MRRHKYNAQGSKEVDKIVTKSNLETNCINFFAKNNLPFEYEPFKVELVAPFEFCSIEYAKAQSKQTCKMRATTYTPDFVWTNNGSWRYVIEAKGMKTPEFSIKWKLFKQWLSFHHPNCQAIIIHSMRDLEAWRMDNQNSFSNYENKCL